MQSKFFNIFFALLMLFALTLSNASAANLHESHFVDANYSKKISMDFKNAALEDVLKIFSQQSKLNFIASDEISNKVISLYLENVPVEQALERILHANNLTYDIVPGSDIFIVKPLQKPDMELVTKIYQLQYASVDSSDINSTFTIETEGEEEEGAAGGGPGGSSGSGEESDGGVLSAIESVLSNNGTITEDKRTNSLIITDIASQFPVIEHAIAKLDIPMVQILIEVEMLDVSKNVGDQIGLRFNATPLEFSGAERDHVYPWNQNELLRQGYAFEEAEYRVGTIDASGLGGILQFIKTDTDTKNLARPRILTLNNQKAEIKISTNEAIGIETNTSGTSAASTQSVEPERTETGVFLAVTPQANVGTGEITMAISPKVIEARAGEAFGGTTFRDPEERGTKSILRVQSGDTIVLGGLIRTDRTKTVRKLPFLGDMPLVGGAFRHKDESEEERELIIFITPHIISESYKHRFANSEYPKILREQNSPDRRTSEIERTLAVFDNKRLN